MGRKRLQATPAESAVAAAHAAEADRKIVRLERELRQLLAVERLEQIHSGAVDFLFDAVLSLKDREECYVFFEDICTINELLSLSQRFEVAKMLREQKTYLEIAEKTGASTATISRVNRSLNYGNDGYDMVFERLKNREDSKSEDEA